MDGTVYIVSNVHRSGSSMIMRCLKHGGMNVAYGDTQEHLNRMGKDYIPNPNGFYAMIDDFRRPDFAKRYAGKALKVPIRDLIYLAPGKYKLLLVKRNPDSIRKSMHAFAPHMPWNQDSTLLEFYDLYMDAMVEEMRKRDDMEVVVMNYEDIVASPTGSFAQLQQAGWPVSVEDAAAMVDPSLQRFKLESS